MIKRHESALKKDDGKAIVAKPESAKSKPRKPFGEKSRIQKLRDLDG